MANEIAALKKILKIHTASSEPRGPSRPYCNEYGLEKNMAPDSHRRRMEGLAKAWKANADKRYGVKAVPVRTTMQNKKRVRLRLKMTVAKEAHEIQQLARRHAVAAMDRLTKIINSESSMDQVALQAIGLLWDRAYGKTAQTNINATVNADGKVGEVSEQQLDERIRQALKRVEELTRGTPKAPPSEERPADIRKLN